MFGNTPYNCNAKCNNNYLVSREFSIEDSSPHYVLFMVHSHVQISMGFVNTRWARATKKITTFLHGIIVWPRRVTKLMGGHAESDLSFFLAGGWGQLGWQYEWFLAHVWDYYWYVYEIKVNYAQEGMAFNGRRALMGDLQWNKWYLHSINHSPVSFILYVDFSLCRPHWTTSKSTSNACLH